MPGDRTRLRDPDLGFPGGGAFSVEFLAETPRRRSARRIARTPGEDPAARLRAAIDADLRQVEHPGHPYYFMLPGGQVFTVALA
ncbi:hypothetical protein [Actinomadura verrucosospora]|uniref:Uncharacterized protein n=1 Tax=Actinomadura verrucosospora TaxID=46165 RepID=A0A7D4AKT9_ACTVE|nr:hypothetical protein [Actinomadura verrucosospora]QKG19129.1 hypothetical protein ACTIVE_0765 [Actinomadura verrucosospora]